MTPSQEIYRVWVTTRDPSGIRSGAEYQQWSTSMEAAAEEVVARVKLPEHWSVEKVAVAPEDDVEEWLVARVDQPEWKLGMKRPDADR